MRKIILMIFILITFCKTEKQNEKDIEPDGTFKEDFFKNGGAKVCLLECGDLIPPLLDYSKLLEAFNKGCCKENYEKTINEFKIKLNFMWYDPHRCVNFFSIRDCPVDWGATNYGKDCKGYSDIKVWKNYGGYKNCTFVLFVPCIKGYSAFFDYLHDPMALKEYKYLCENGFEEEKFFYFAGGLLHYNLITDVLTYKGCDVNENDLNCVHFHTHYSWINREEFCTKYYNEGPYPLALPSQWCKETELNMKICNEETVEGRIKLMIDSIHPIEWKPLSDGDEMIGYGRCETWACLLKYPYIPFKKGEIDSSTTENYVEGISKIIFDDPHCMKKKISQLRCKDIPPCPPQGSEL